jgi:hypothetical protein
MADYEYSDDGNIHTRYTELMRCTPGQIERVIAEHQNLSPRFKSDNLDFGSLRHEMWQEETDRTGKLPECFGLDWAVSHCEQEFASMVLPGVVLHSRPDAVCADISTLVDYKTLIADNVEQGALTAVIRYKHSKQLPLYAYQLGLHGIRVRRIAYCVEIWNRPELDEFGNVIRPTDTVLGYKTIVRDLTLADMAEVLPWLKQRCALLAATLQPQPV